MAGFMPAILFAETADKDGFDLLRGFSREIYVMAEKNGGSVEQWDLAEAEIISAFERLQKTGSLDITQRDRKGRTLLSVAASNGTFPAVAWILAQAGGETPAWLNARDAKGLSALDHAALGLRQTLLACHPDTEKLNPFALVPVLVTAPYFADRNPYSASVNALHAAGAQISPSTAKDHWLKHCSSTDEKLRQAVLAAHPLDLFPTLLAAHRDVLEDDCRKKVLETQQFLLSIRSKDLAEGTQARREFDNCTRTEAEGLRGGKRPLNTLWGRFSVVPGLI
jgi:hypothetical protein